MAESISKPITLSFSFSGHLYNHYQTCKDSALIIDTRDSESYQNNYLRGSISLNNKRIIEHLQKKPIAPDLANMNITDLSEMLEPEEARKFAKRRRCFCFLIMTGSSLPGTLMDKLKQQAVMDDREEFCSITDTEFLNILEENSKEIHEKESILNALEIFKIMQKDKVRELFLVIDGILDFFKRYPYMNAVPQNESNQKTCDKPLKLDLPHDILDGRLFLGSFEQAQKYCLVMALKVTHILNMTCECENVHEDKGIKYLKVSILDENDKDIISHFRVAYEFIDEALSESRDNIVLVHCAQGKSRSATAIIMYLMKKFSWTYEKAYCFVKSKRELIEPNEGFALQLQKFEVHQHAFCDSLKLPSS